MTPLHAPRTTVRTTFRRALLAPRIAALVALLAVAATAAAQTAPADAMAAADARPAVVDAERALADARADLRRTDADPLALRLDRLQATQAVALAEAELRVARFGAYQEIGAAYMDALEATAQRALAAQAADLAERSAEIAAIRAERGAATDLDVRDAENDLAGARSDLAAARDGETLARTNLASLLGVAADDLGTLAELPDAWVATPTPDPDALVARLEETPTVLRAAQGLEVARTARDLLDPAYAAAQDLEDADSRIAGAETGLAEARRALAIAVRSLVDRVASARERLDVARDALANARDRDAVDRSRLDAGLISDVAYERTRLATTQADLAALQAEHAVVRAALTLQADTGLALEGLDAF